jgi:hypothetical protein
MAIEGGCRCGRVRFRVEAEPISARACWCRDCQYIAAGSPTINVVFPSEALTVSGETREYVSTSDAGATMRHRFCPACGTPLFNAADSRPHLVIVRAGTLDQRTVAPQAVIWTASAPAWAQVAPGLPAYEHGPPPAIGAPSVPAKS